jgi:hypothetical protein
LSFDLEFLRLQQRVDEIHKKKEGGNATNQVVHKVSVFMPKLKAITGFGEQPAQQEESQSDQHICKVKHVSLL